MLLSVITFGGLVGASFSVGALAAGLNRWGHRGFAMVMGFGAGLLLATALADLAPHAIHAVGLVKGLTILLLAALTYSLINHYLATRGAKHRKRCGECKAPAHEAKTNGSGQAIVLGTVMDAVPEALVLGVIAAEGSPPFALLAALFLGNMAQAMSATAGLRHSGRSSSFVFSLWVGVGLLFVGLSGVAALSAQAIGDSGASVLMAMASGVLIAMIAEAMLPEAAEESSPYLGVVTALGAATYFLIH